MVLVAGVMAPAAWLLTACGGSNGDLISTVALPSQQTTGYAEGAGMPLAADSGRLSGTPELTPAQRDYLGALAAAGIRPTNELRALGIGAYVCQARGAGGAGPGPPEGAQRRRGAPPRHSDAVRDARRRLDGEHGDPHRHRKALLKR